MDIVDQTLLNLLDGVDRGAANVVTLGTTMAAKTLWDRIRRRTKSSGRYLSDEEETLLEAEPGQPVDVDTLRRLLESVPRSELTSPAIRGDRISAGRDQLKIRGDYVAGDKFQIGRDQNVYINPVIGDSSGAGRIESWPAHTGPRSAARTASRWDAGVITVLSEETRAVTAMLRDAGDCRNRSGPDGLRFCEAQIETGDRSAGVVALQTLDRGQRSAVMAFEQLRQHYAPTTVVLVGIAGGINPDVRLGDVVVAREVIYYDLRKERSDQVVHRGQERAVPAATWRAVNNFFSDHGEPWRADIPGPDGVRRTCSVLPGPIGSGEAVVANKDSEIRQYLIRFNDKTLALDTEAGGVLQAFYETTGAASPVAGCLVVRGISDHADTAKDDTYHEIASWHAAGVFRQLLPYLVPSDGDGG